MNKTYVLYKIKHVTVLILTKQNVQSIKEIDREVFHLKSIIDLYLRIRFDSLFTFYHHVMCG